MKPRGERELRVWARDKFGGRYGDGKEIIRSAAIGKNRCFRKGPNVKI